MATVMKPKALVIVFLGLLAFALSALPEVSGHAKVALPAQTAAINHTLELVGQIGGSFKALAAQDGYVYAAIGPRLVVLDVTSPTSPVLKGQTAVLPIDIQTLAIQRERVYAAAGRDGLYIFDVSDPTQPVEVGSLNFPGLAIHIAITGTYGFVTTSAELKIVDVADPTLPQCIGSYPVIARDIAISGHTLFIVLEEAIRILDISDPGNPTLIINYPVPADEIEIEGNLVYVGKTSSVWGPTGPIYYGILRILDVSALPAITEVFFSGDEYPSSVPSHLRDMRLLNQHLYGYSYDCGRPSNPCGLAFGAVDVSNPLNPTLEYTSLYQISRYDWYWGDVAVAGEHIYMATQDTLHIFDSVTNTRVVQYVSWQADDLSVANGVAYVAARSAGLLTIDVSQPTRPQMIGVYTTTVEGSLDPAKITDVALYGPYLYAQVAPSGLGMRRMDVLDVSNSAHLERLTAANWFWYGAPLHIHNGQGYYIFDGHLRGVNLNYPSQPTDTLGNLATSISGPQLALAGSYAYIAGIYEGLHVIDVTYPHNFVDVKRLAGPLPALLMESTPDALYIFTDEALKIYDLADLVNPQETSSTPVTGLRNLVDMNVRRNHVYQIQNEIYTAPYTASVRIFHTPDLTSPASELVSYARPGGVFTALAVVGDLVYVTSATDGLLIFRHSSYNPELPEKIYLPLVSQQVAMPPATCELAYRVHLENYDWLPWVCDESVAGLAGHGLRVEAVQVSLGHGLPDTMSIVYQAHVQEIGWMDWVYAGQIAGTTGQSKRVEAVRFKLLNAPEGYGIIYSVYVEGSGWTEWMADGEPAGTVGLHERIEAIRIMVVQP